MPRSSSCCSSHSRSPPPPALAQSQPARPTGLTADVKNDTITLLWNQASGNVDRYQYQVNHNDTGTGKLTGWSPWADIPQSNGASTSHTFTGLAFGKEYRYKIRAVEGFGEGETRSKPAPATAPWYVSAIIPDPRPPALSHLWTVRVCDDLFKVRWHFVPGATGYDLNMSGNHRQSWQRKMTNKNVNAWQFSQWTKNATFWFAVRAVNAHGASEWRYVKSIAPPCQVEGLQASHLPSAGGQSGTITATWNPAKRASGYDVNFTADAGRSWQRMATDLRATSYEFTKHIPYNPNYRVAVQTRRKGVTSGWSNAPIAGLIAANVAGTTATLNFNGYTGNWYYKANDPPDDTCKGPVSGSVKNLTGLHAGTDYQYTAYRDSGCTDTISNVTFSTPVTLTVSNVTATGATLNLAGHDLQWWYDADTGPHTTCQGPVNAGTSTADLSGLTANQQYAYRAYNAAGCNDGDLLASVTFTPSGDVLTAKEVAATTAVLELTGHTGNWWLKETSPGTGTCADTGETASVDFTTGGVSVSNLSHQSASGCLLGSTGDEKCATGFTTGDSANGYTLHSITAAFSHTNGSPSNFAIASPSPCTGSPATDPPVPPYPTRL